MEDEGMQRVLLLSLSGNCAVMICICHPQILCFLFEMYLHNLKQAQLQLKF